MERDFASFDLKVWWLEKASFIKKRAAEEDAKKHEERRIILSMRWGPFALGVATYSLDLPLGFFIRGLVDHLYVFFDFQLDLFLCGPSELTKQCFKLSTLLDVELVDGHQSLRVNNQSRSEILGDLGCPVAKRIRTCE